MAVTNFLKSLRDSVWTLLEANSDIDTIIDGKYVKRPVLREDIDPGMAPYLAAWILTPDRAWWAGKTGRFDITMIFFGVVNANDREDHDGIEQLYLELMEAFRVDLCETAGGGVMRTQGNVIFFTQESGTFGYFEDLESEEGATFVEVNIVFTLQNPNAHS